MTDQVATVSADGCLDALGDVSRRRLLVSLLRADDEGREAVDLRAVDAASNATRAEVPLYHVHLPKLESMDLVDVDYDRGVVSRGPGFDEVEPLLELLEENRDRLPDDWV